MSESLNTSSSAESNSTNESLINVGVSFSTKQIDMDSQSRLSNINSEVDIPNLTVDINDAIPIVMEDKYNENSKVVAEGIINLKDCVKSVKDKLYETIDFLKHEFEEKNLLIRALIVRDANDGNPLIENTNATVNTVKCRNNTASNLASTGITADRLDKSQTIQYIVVNYDLTSDNNSCQGTVLNRTHIHEVINNSSMNEANSNVYIVNELQDASSNVDMNDFYYSNISSRNISIPSERFAWEKHSSGVATKIMNKMGYKGKGLGKRENGITETIKIKPRKTRC